MFHLLGFLGIFALIFIFVILIVVLRIFFGGLRMFRNLGRGIFGGGRTYNYSNGGRTYNYSTGGNYNGSSACANRKQTVHDNRSQDTANRKIFNKNEGEYVDFEEVI